MTNPTPVQELSEDLVRRLGVAADGIEKVGFDRRSIRRIYEELLREAATALTGQHSRAAEAVGEAAALAYELRQMAAIEEAVITHDGKLTNVSSRPVAIWRRAAALLASGVKAGVTEAGVGDEGMGEAEPFTEEEIAEARAIWTRPTPPIQGDAK